MTWARVDDKLHSSIKWRMASRSARALWVTSLSWCMDQLTDGHVPTEMLRVLDGTKRDANDLVRVGLWEAAEGGYVFHDWADYQPDAASIKAKQAAESTGGREGNHKRWHVARNITVPDCEFCSDAPSGGASGTRSGGRGGTRIGGESSQAQTHTPTNSSKRSAAPPVTREPDEPPPDPYEPEMSINAILASAGLAQHEHRDFLVDLKGNGARNTTALVNALHRDGKLTARIGQWRDERNLAAEAASRPAPSKPNRAQEGMELARRLAAEEGDPNVIPLRQIEGA